MCDFALLRLYVRIVTAVCNDDLDKLSSWILNTTPEGHCGHSMKDYASSAGIFLRFQLFQDRNKVGYQREYDVLKRKGYADRGTPGILTRNARGASCPILKHRITCP